MWVGHHFGSQTSSMKGQLKHIKESFWKIIEFWSHQKNQCGDLFWILFTFHMLGVLWVDGACPTCSPYTGMDYAPAFEVFYFLSFLLEKMKALENN